MRRIGLVFARWLLSCLALACPLYIGLAQDTGQICLSAFADDNGDGMRDANEMPLNRGVAASLLNANDLTLVSQLLADSPYADHGMLCFDQLRAGDYKLIISSSAFNPTSATRAEASVQPGAPPAHIEFGAKPLTTLQSAIPPVDAFASSGLLLALAGMALGVVVVSLLGALFVARQLRRRQRARLSPSSGRPAETPAPDHNLRGSPRLSKDPSEGSPPLFTDDE